MKFRRMLVWLLVPVLLVGLFPALALAEVGDSAWRPPYDPTQPACDTHEHVYADWVTEEEGTCTERGSRYRICQICGRYDYDFPFAPHTFGDWEIVEHGSDRAAAVRQRTCQVCGYVETENVYPEGTLLPGMSGPEVSALQQALYETGYYPHRVTGQYDEYTEHAVHAFQQDQGLEPDGIAWPNTRDRLIHDFGPWKITVEPTRTTVGRIERTCHICGYTEARDYGAYLFPGDWGEAVKALQEALNAQGYEVEVNSSYDNGTKKAVSDCEEDNGLVADGVTQPDLWPILFPLVNEDELGEPEEAEDAEADSEDAAPGYIKSMLTPDIHPGHSARLEIHVTSEPENGSWYQKGEEYSYYYVLINDSDLEITEAVTYKLTYANLTNRENENTHPNSTRSFLYNVKAHDTFKMYNTYLHVTDEDVEMGEIYTGMVAFVTFEDGYVAPLLVGESFKTCEGEAVLENVSLYYEMLSEPKNGKYFTPGETVAYRLVISNGSKVDIQARVYPATESNFDNIGKYVDFYVTKSPAFARVVGEVTAGMMRLCWEKSFTVEENPEALYWFTEDACAVVKLEDGDITQQKPLTASLAVPIGPKVASAELELKAQNQPENNEYFWEDAVVGFDLDLYNTGDYDLDSASFTITFPDGSTQTIDYPGSVPSLTDCFVGESSYTFTAADIEAGEVEIKVEGKGLAHDAAGKAIEVPVSAVLPLKTGVKPQASISFQVTNTPADGHFFAPGETIEYEVVINNYEGEEPIRKGTLRANYSDGLVEVIGNIPEIAPHSSSAPIPFSRTLSEELVKLNPTLGVTAEAEVEFEDLTRQTLTSSLTSDLGIVNLAIDVETSSSPNADGFYCRDDEIVYEITVTNTGTVTIPTVDVYDTDPAGTTKLGSITNLAAGESRSFTHLYTVGPTDVIEKIIVNHAYAQATLEVEAMLEVEDWHRDRAGMYPADVGLTKTVTSSPKNGYFYQADEVITYEITVTNNGPEALPQLTLTDMDPAGTVFLDTLIHFVPGDSFTYTHSHTVTAAEAEAGGMLGNTVYADYVLPDDSTDRVEASVESPVGVEADHCVRLELGLDENGEMQYRIERCEMHLTLEVDCEAGIEAAADEAGKVEALKQAVERWTESVQNEYTAIIGSTTDEEMQAQISGERDAFMAWIEAKGAKLLEANPEDEAAALRAVLDDLMERCADLCEIHHTCPADELFERVMKTAAFIEGYITE